MTIFDVYHLLPVEIVRGAGSLVWDKYGTEYLDMYGGHAVISIGHCHPHYTKRINEQLQLLGFYSNSVQIPIQAALAEKLGLLSHKPDYQLFLCNSGAEANENALKLASFYNGRKKVIAFEGAFHGRTSLAVAVTDNRKIQAPINTTEYVIRLPWNDEAALERAFATEGDQIAAVIIEGIQGVGGIHVASHSFLKQIRALCNAHNAIYIADAVQCGYGRSGTFFAHDAAGVEADIYTMAKGMGNGFPVAGVAIHPKIKPWHGMLGTTFGGNHLACVAALAVLEVIENEHLIKNAQQVGSYLKAELSQMPNITEVRGSGLMIGIELPAHVKGLQKQLVEQAHIFTGSANPNVIRLLPALNLTMAQADRFLQGFKDILDTF
jgi:acetylornithine aminotransferase